jgi:hypothetical protein
VVREGLDPEEPAGPAYRFLHTTTGLNGAHLGETREHKDTMSVPGDRSTPPRKPKILYKVAQGPSERVAGFLLALGNAQHGSHHGGQQEAPDHSQTGSNGDPPAIGWPPCTGREIRNWNE